MLSVLNLTLRKTKSSVISSKRFRKTAFLFTLTLSLTFQNHITFSQAYSTMSKHTTQTDGNTITISPKNEADQSALVIILHGLGDTSQGFLDVAEHLASQLPHVKFILPTAPTQPVTMNMGMSMPSWYDITGLDERANENCRGIAKSRETIQSLLEKEHETNRLPYNRMVCMGFSQGGALSLFTGMQLPQMHKLAGIVIMSGYLPAKSQFQITPGLESTPIMHCHGESDPMIQLQMAKKSVETVKEMGATDYTFKTYRGLTHSVNMDEIQDILDFLRHKLPMDENCKVQLKDPDSMSIKELKEAIRNAGLGSKAVGLMEKSEFIKLVKDHREGKL